MIARTLCIACRVDECAEPALPKGDLCRYHRTRLHKYGQTGPIHPPIPMAHNEGAAPEKVRELAAMTWSELVAYCEAVLEAG